MKIYINSKYYPFLKGFSKKERAKLIKKAFATNKKLQFLFYAFLALSLFVTGIIFYLLKPYVPHSYWPILAGVSFGIFWYLCIVFMLSTYIYKASKNIFEEENSKSNTESKSSTN